MSEHDPDALDNLLPARPTIQTVFHYTSQEGLLGIVQSESLWVTSIRHLNDSTELEYAVELTRAMLLRKVEDKGDPLLNYYQDVLARLDVIKDVFIFVGSFSE